MDSLIHRTPSVGSIVNKIMNINPDLSVQDIIALIRQSTRTQGKAAGEYSAMEIVDERLALELARDTLKKPIL